MTTSAPPPSRAPGDPRRSAVARQARQADVWLRVPVLVWFVWIFWHHLRDPLYTSLWNGLNLVFHEMGHALFMWSGSEFWTTAGGTILEWAVPLLAGVALWRQGERFGAAICLCWLATALYDSAAYAADARLHVLPLVSPFGLAGPEQHDWTNLLTHFGALEQDRVVALWLRRAAAAAMLAGLAWGLWVLRAMWPARVAGTAAGRAAAR